ncbi:L,D-transpeptidase family protein [Dermabacteraceae bacterium P13138]
MTQQFDNGHLEQSLPEGEGRRGKRALLILLALFLAGTVALVGGGIAHARQFDGRALPGTLFMGADVGGQSAAEIEQLIAKQAEATKVTVNVDGKEHTASFKDLGISVDNAATVQGLVAKDPSLTDVVSSYLGKGREGKPVVKVDEKALAAWAQGLIPADKKKAQDAALKFNEESGAWEVVPGQAGQGLDVDGLTAQVRDNAANLKDFSLNADVREVNPRLSDETAQATATELNQTFATSLRLSAGEKSWHVGPKQLESWVKVDTNAEGTGFVATIDRDAIANDVASFARKAAVKPVDGKELVDDSGKVVKVVTQKKDGVEVSGEKELVSQIVTALENKTPLAAGLVTKPVKAKVVQDKVPKEDEKKKAEEEAKKKAEEEAKKKAAEEAKQKEEKQPAAEEEKTEQAAGIQVPKEVKPGANWVDIDLTKKTLTVYNGTNVVFGPRKIVDGKKDWETTLGTFKIYHRLEKQDMTNEARYPKDHPLYYYTKDVPWVMYFKGGYAIHGAYWRKSFGYSGSHGCINMSVSDAKWVYDHTTYGTVVRTHF